MTNNPEYEQNYHDNLRQTLNERLRLANREKSLQTEIVQDLFSNSEKIMTPETLLRKDNVRIIQQCENNCELLRLYDTSQSRYYLDNIKEFSLLNLTYGHLLRTGASIPLGVRYFNKEIEYGLLTLSNLKKDDFIGQYTGIIQISDRDIEEIYLAGQHFSSDYTWDYPSYPEDWPEIEISAENAGNALRYTNHSFNPNCRVEHTLIDGFWLLFFLADCDIPAGSQLLVNYGENYWASDIRKLVYI